MKYPIGIQNFEKLRRDGYAYVDKTALMWKMVSEGSYYFLSRPRRFGKSLLISTLEAFFTGKKELFNDLYVDSVDWDWQEYPIMHLDLNTGKYDTKEALDAMLNNFLCQMEFIYGSMAAEVTFGLRFQGVIRRAFEKTGKQVVILVDEYDKPMLQAIGNDELQTEYRNTLKAFYGAMSRHAGVLSVDPMTQIAIYQQEQTALIQTMAKDLNGTFTENMAAAVHDAIDPLNQSFKNFVNVSTKEQMRFMDAVMQRFADRLDETMRGRLQRFGEVLDETSRQQQESCVVVRASLAGAKDALEDLQKMQDLSRETLNGMSDYVRELNDASRQTGDTLARQQSNYLKTVSSMQADLNRIVDAMQKATGDLRSSAASIEKVHIQANRQLQDEFNSTMDAYRDYVNQFTQRVDYLAGNISSALQGLPDAVSDVNNRFLDQVDRLTDAMVQAQQALEDTADRLYRP